LLQLFAVLVPTTCDNLWGQILRQSKLGPTRNWESFRFPEHIRFRPSRLFPRPRPCASVRSMQLRRTNQIILAHCVGFTLLTLVLAATADVRLSLTPRFVPGEVLRYRIESRTTTTGKTTTPIVNPEGGSQSTQAIHMVVRMDTLSVGPSGKVRFRATYEKSSAESESDALDLSASSMADQYNRFEGRSIELTMEPGGQFTDLQDTEAAPTGQSASGQPGDDPVLALLQGLSLGSVLPAKGVAVGQKWTSEQPIAGALLSGLVRRTESSYLRNEPCGSSGGSKASASQSGVRADDCAVILTHFEILRHGSAHSDATPDDYRRNGLRTSGTWTGSGESLDSISLSTELLVSSTHTSTQEMDYQITSASTGSSIHHVGKVRSQSEVNLLPDQP
jgi:hypothetical protein